MFKGGWERKITVMREFNCKVKVLRTIGHRMLAFKKCGIGRNYLQYLSNDCIIAMQLLRHGFSVSIHHHKCKAMQLLTDMGRRLFFCALHPHSLFFLQAMTQAEVKQREKSVLTDD